MLAHFSRTGGAVQADHVDAKRLQGCECGTNFGSQQHGAGGLDGHLYKQGESNSGLNHRCATGVNGGLGLKQILGSFHHEGVSSTLD